MATQAQGLGDTILLNGAESDLDALAVCHCGAGPEAGEDVCFIELGAVHPGPDAADRFALLLNACEQPATEKGLGNGTPAESGPPGCLPARGRPRFPYLAARRDHAHAQRTWL